MDRILFLRDALAKTSGALPESDPLKKRVSDFDGKADAVRKEIVATKEGGAITGEERLREHTDQLYGALLSYEGKPGDYQLAYFEALKRELADASKEFAGLVAKDLPALNDALKAKGQSTISPPPEKVAVNDDTANFPGGGSVGGQIDHDGPAAKVTLPADFRFLR
jgi:hypothetical protein